MSDKAERKEVRAECELKDTDSEHGTFSLRAAHIGLPPDQSNTRDILRAGATTPAHWAVFGGWQHSGMHGAVPAGKVLMSERDGHVVGDGVFFPTPTGQEYRKMLQGLGDLAQFSVEYRVIAEDVLSDHELAAGAGRAIRKWRILGIAPVLEGAMPFTGLTDIKCTHCQRETDDDARVIARIGAREAQRFADILERADIPVGVALPPRFTPAVKFAAWKLSIPSPKMPAIKMVAPGSLRDGGVGMFAVDRNEVCIVAGQSEQETLRTLFHELAHAGETCRGWLPDEGLACVLEKQLYSQFSDERSEWT